MKRQDFLANTFKDLKFKILFPGELVTTQEDINNFAIGFADWVRVCKLKQRPYDFDNIKELLEIYKDEKGL